MSKTSRGLISALVITVMIGSIFTLPVISDDYIVDAAAKKIKVIYKTNGGKFTTKKYAKKSSITKKVKKGKKRGTAPKISKKGYTLKGWYTAKKKGKKTNKNTKIKKKTTLYARWVAKSYTVTFDAAGGTLTQASKKIKYDSKYGTLPVPVKKDNLFKGWFTAPTGGVQVTDATVYKTAGASTLYAQWEKQFTVNTSPFVMIGMTLDEQDEFAMNNPSIAEKVNSGGWDSNNIVIQINVKISLLFPEVTNYDDPSSAPTAQQFMAESKHNWVKAVIPEDLKDGFKYGMYYLEYDDMYLYIRIDDNNKILEGIVYFTKLSPTGFFDLFRGGK